MPSNVVDSATPSSVIACPHCRRALRVDSRFSGQRLACPKCRGALVIPSLRPQVQERTEEKFELPAIIAVVLGIHLVVGMLVGLFAGLGIALLLLTLVGAVELLVWKRKTVVPVAVATVKLWRASQRDFAEATRAQRETQRAVTENKPKESVSRNNSVPPNTQERAQQTAKRDTAPPNTLPVTAQSDSSGRRSEPIPPRPTSSEPEWPDFGSPSSIAESIPAQKPARNWYGFWGDLRTLSGAGAVLPAEVAFFGPSTPLYLDRGTIFGALVYATSSPQHGSFDASLIDGSLPIAPPHVGKVEDLPYWPTYRDASPGQRSCYLDWLVGGRCDPGIELGYVFIYFYGLERRILLDNEDHQAVAEEVLRLRGIYRHSRSFQRYSSSLLWMILALTAKRSPLSTEVVEKVFATTERWDEERLGSCLAYLHDSQAKLNPEWAYLVAKQDRRVQSSVIVRRHENLFADLFRKKFAQRFPEGMELQASKRATPLTYRPASGTLLESSGGRITNRFVEIPNVLGIESQFKPLVELWNECVDEMRAYDKAHRVQGELSAAAYEALPAELRQGEHPDYAKWFDLWRQTVNTDGVPVVSLPQLAALKGIAERRTLLKSQCLELLQTADSIGIGLEPDSRLMGRNYRWDDVVTMFLLDGEESSDPAAYQAAASMLQLGLTVAAADGQVDPDEVVRITQHLEDQFELTREQSRRLEASRLLLQHTRPDAAKLFSQLKKRLSTSQRVLVGEYLIGIAAADQIITPEENHCLQRIFAGLEIPSDRLRQLMQPVVTAIPVGATPAGSYGAAEASFYLDQQAISRIMRDTDEVASILRTAMAEADEENADDDVIATASNTAARVPVAATIATATANNAPSSAAEPIRQTRLDPSNEPPPRFHAFYHSLILKAEWSEAEAKEMARKHGVMLGGAVEALNEWSQDRWNDWLIEEGDPLRVRLDLLERKSL